MTLTHKRFLLDLAGLAFLVTGIAVAVYFLGGLLAPLFIACFLAYVLSPLVDILERRGLSRLAAVSSIFLMFVLALAAMLVLLVPNIDRQVATLHEQLPYYADLSKQTVESFQATLAERFPAVKRLHLAEEVGGRASGYLDGLLARVPDFLFDVFTILSVAVLIPFFTWYLLIEGVNIKKALIELVPNRYFETALNLIYRVDRHLSQYLLGQLADVVAVGLLSAIGYSLIGVRYGVVIGILSGFANLIPYVGPTAGAVAALVVTVLETGYSEKLLEIILFASAVQVVDNFLIQPQIISKATDIHPFTTLLVVVIGAQILGPWGLILSIPAFVVCKVFFQELAGVLRRQSTVT